jgi:hypothetical protein
MPTINYTKFTFNKVKVTSEVFEYIKTEPYQTYKHNFISYKASIRIIRKDLYNSLFCGLFLAIIIACFDNRKIYKLYNYLQTYFSSVLICFFLLGGFFTFASYLNFITENNSFYRKLTKRVYRSKDYEEFITKYGKYY